MARIELAAPTHIKLYKTLPFLNPNHRLLTPQQFEEMENIRFCEGVETPEDFSIPLPAHYFSIKTEMILSQIEQLQRESQDYIALANMEEIGLGAFANKEILPGTVVGYYSGEVTPPTYRNQNIYSLALQKGDVQLVINPQNLRGLTNYIQHLPSFLETNSGLVSSSDFRQQFILNEKDCFKKDLVANVKRLVKYAEATLEYFITFSELTPRQGQLRDYIQEHLPLYHMILEKGINHPDTINKWMVIILKTYPGLSLVPKEKHPSILEEAIPGFAIGFLEKLEDASFQNQQTPSETLTQREFFTSFTKIEIKNQKKLNVNEIATANLIPLTIVSGGETPVFMRVFIASTLIKPGMILGFDYGKTYFWGENKAPKLFNKYGMDLAGYYQWRPEKICLKLDSERSTVLNSSALPQVLQKGFIDSGQNKHFSSYTFREKLKDLNILSPSYLPLPYSSSFLFLIQEKLKEVLGEDAALITALIFWTNPDKHEAIQKRTRSNEKDENEAYTQELVLRAETPVVFNALLNFFKPIENLINKEEKTRELIIPDTNKSADKYRSKLSF